MDARELSKLVTDKGFKEREIFLKLINASRAAYNAMMDAKMERTAQPLGELLFQYDALHEETMKVLNAQDPATVIDSFIKLIEKQDKADNNL